MSTPPPPTGTRHWLIVFAIGLAIVQYIDRVCISQAKPEIAAELQLSNTQMGAIFAAFALAYALFEIPTGWLGDRWGARKVLAGVTLWWSFFTAATGWVGGYLSLWWTRFLFGAGAAGCFPNLTKALSAWLPGIERTRAQTLMWMGARWGGAVTPLLVVFVMTFVPWRTAFLVFALLGVIWVAAFWIWFRDDPRDHRGLNAAERELLRENARNAQRHAHVPWRRLATHRTMWLLWIQYFCLSYGWYFYVTWLPDYLSRVRGTEIRANAVMAWVGGLLEGNMSEATATKVLAATLAGIPLLFGGFGALLAGSVSSRLLRAGGGVARIRRGFALAGFTGAGVLLMTSFYIQDALLAMLAMGLASFCNDMTMPGSWSTCMDVGGRCAGTVSGSMNMMGNFGGMAFPLVTGWVLDRFDQNYQIVFLVAVIIYFIGALCWLKIDPVTPLEREESFPPAGR